MRSDWVPLSASALVIGAMCLVLGSVLNPAESGASAAETFAVVQEASGRWLAMAVMYFLASLSLTLGLPAVLTLLDRRGRTLGLIGLAVFTLGAIGTCGYAMLMVFFRALVGADAVRSDLLDEVTSDPGLTIFLQGWIGGFYGGIALLAIALLRSRSTARWVPWLMLAFVAVLPFAAHIGRFGTAVQILTLAVAFTGIATAAVTGDHRTRTLQRSAF